MIDGGTEHIARISYGKDSLKMLEVIRSRGLPLDRITTTDVWATDTIPAYLPPLAAFRDRMDQWIWDQYRIEVEHLCSRNKDGTKRTYEQMFYHVPVRRSQSGQVEREREDCPGRSTDSRTCGADGVRDSSRGMYRIQGSIKGFPGITGVNWCQKLKICGLSNQGIPTVPEGKRGQVVPRPQDSLRFLRSAGRGAKTEISLSILESLQTNHLATVS